MLTSVISALGLWILGLITGGITILLVVLALLAVVTVGYIMFSQEYGEFFWSAVILLGLLGVLTYGAWSLGDEVWRERLRPFAAQQGWLK